MKVCTDRYSKILIQRNGGKSEPNDNATIEWYVGCRSKYNTALARDDVLRYLTRSRINGIVSRNITLGGRESDALNCFRGGGTLKNHARSGTNTAKLGVH